MSLHPTTRARESGPLIDVVEVAKSYGRQQVLSGVTLAVAAGEVAVLVGAHGSGKSTLLRILVDVVRPSAGSARVLGASTRRGASSRSRVGYVPSPVRQPTVGSVRSALSYAAALSKSRAGLAAAMASRFGLDLRARVARLSPSDAQKLALVAGLAHRPAVVLLDEPTTDLDADAVAVLLEVVDDLRKAGAAVLVASHRLAPFESLADTVHVLRYGTVSLSGAVPAMRRTLPSIAIVEFLTDPPLAELSRIDPDLVVAGRRVRLNLGSQPGALLSLLRGNEVVTLQVATPTLSDALAGRYGQDDPGEGRSVIGDGP